MKGKNYKKTCYKYALFFTKNHFKKWRSQTETENYINFDAEIGNAYLTLKFSYVI